MVQAGCGSLGHRVPVGNLPQRKERPLPVSGQLGDIRFLPEHLQADNIAVEWNRTLQIGYFQMDGT
ncbi:hypothetical protein D3C73_1625580 [compost metagenome]